MDEPIGFADIAIGQNLLWVCIQVFFHCFKKQAKFQNTTLCLVEIHFDMFLFMTRHDEKKRLLNLALLWERVKTCSCPIFWDVIFGWYYNILG